MQKSVSKVEETKESLIFGYYVSNPKSYGVCEFDKNGNVLSIEEKPENPKTRKSTAQVGFSHPHPLLKHLDHAKSKILLFHPHHLDNKNRRFAGKRIVFFLNYSCVVTPDVASIKPYMTMRTRLTLKRIPEAHQPTTDTRDVLRVALKFR